MSKLFLLASLTIALVGNASGYGNAGHQAIGTVAERYLEGTRALTEVRLLRHLGRPREAPGQIPQRRDEGLRR